MTVRELERRMPSAELTEWMAFYTIDPFGDQRADMRSAIISSTLANCHRDKDRKAFQYTDFMPFPDEPYEELNEAQQVKQMILGLGVDIIEKKRDG